jgi:hypothetical protein
MSAASDFLETKLLDHALRVTAYNASAFTSSATLYLALFTATTGLETNSPSAEISTSGTGYGRKAVAFSAATGTNPTTSVTSGTVTFDAATSSWGTVTHIAVMDAATSGNVLFHGAVTTSKTIDTGDTFQVSAGNLTISLA